MQTVVAAVAMMAMMMMMTTAAAAAAALGDKAREAAAARGAAEAVATLVGGRPATRTAAAAGAAVGQAAVGQAAGSTEGGRWKSFFRRVRRRRGRCSWTRTRGGAERSQRLRSAGLSFSQAPQAPNILPTSPPPQPPVTLFVFAFFSLLCRRCLQDPNVGLGLAVWHRPAGGPFHDFKFDVTLPSEPAPVKTAVKPSPVERPVQPPVVES